jgi:hypothetical protein
MGVIEELTMNLGVGEIHSFVQSKGIDVVKALLEKALT